MGANPRPPPPCTSAARHLPPGQPSYDPPAQTSDPPPPSLPDTGRGSRFGGTYAQCTGVRFVDACHRGCGQRMLWRCSASAVRRKGRWGVAIKAHYIWRMRGFAKMAEEGCRWVFPGGGKGGWVGRCSVACAPLLTSAASGGVHSPASADRRDRRGVRDGKTFTKQ